MGSYKKKSAKFVFIRCLYRNQLDITFESYHYTTVATATLCYYMAPVFVTLSAPFMFKERLTQKKIFCITGALVGMVLVSGIWNTGISGTGELWGVFYGIGAAVFYASVILLNKKIQGISAYDKTMMQLAASSIVLLPYTVLTEKVSVLSLTPMAVILLAVVGILHTGISYTLYFGSMKNLEAQTIAIFSYIDPIVAILFIGLVSQRAIWNQGDCRSDYGTGSRFDQ